jgi:hypothetical protein
MAAGDRELVDLGPQWTSAELVRVGDFARGLAEVRGACFRPRFVMRASLPADRLSRDRLGRGRKLPGYARIGSL